MVTCQGQIILAPFFLIAQHVIGLLHGDEHTFQFRLDLKIKRSQLGMAVGMELLGQLPIGFFEFFRGEPPVDAQNLVVASPTIHNPQLLFQIEAQFGRLPGINPGRCLCR